MIKQPIRILLNTFLVLLFSGMLILPVVLVHVVTGVAHVPASVAGAQHQASDLVVLPNFFDFGDHVKFDPSYNAIGYQDNVTLTVFRSQIATYHKLYTVHNRAADTIVVRGVLGAKPESSSVYDSLIVTLAKTGEVHSTTVAKQAQVGDVSLTATDANVAQNVDTLIVGMTEIPVLSVSGRFISTDPLAQGFDEGMPIYRAGIFILDGKVYRSRTNDVVLEPGESVTVNTVVMGKKDVETQTITVPLFINVVR